MATIGERGRLISSDKVEGTRVVNASGEDLGHISEIMIDKPTGQVAYAVLKYGSFVGLGGKLFAVPWDVLSYEPAQDAYVVDLPEDRLRDAPSLEPTDRMDLSDSSWNRQVHDYYGSRADWYNQPF